MHATDTSHISQQIEIVSMAESKYATVYYTTHYTYSIISNTNNGNIKKTHFKFFMIRYL